MADNTELTDAQKKGLEILNSTVDLPVKTADQIAADEAAKLEAERLAEEQKKADELKAKADKEAADKLADEGNKPPENTLDDAALLKMLQERGVPIESLDALRPKPTEEELQQQAAQREADRVAFGLSKGKFNNDEFQSYLNDLKDPASAVFAQYRADALAADPEITEAELEAEFAEKFSTDADPDSRKFKRGQTEIAALAQGIITEKHKKVISANGEYDGLLSQKENETKAQAHIAQHLPVYQSDVKEAAASVKNLTFKIGGEDIEVDIDPTVVASIATQMSEAQFANQQILNGYQKDNLKATFESAAYLQDFNRIVVAAAEAYHLKKAAGIRGIPPANVNTNTDEPIHTEQQKAALDRLRKQFPNPVPAN